MFGCPRPTCSILRANSRYLSESTQTPPRPSCRFFFSSLSQRRSSLLRPLEAAQENRDLLPQGEDAAETRKLVDLTDNKLLIQGLSNPGAFDILYRVRICAILLCFPRFFLRVSPSIPLAVAYRGLRHPLQGNRISCSYTSVQIFVLVPRPDLGLGRMFVLVLFFCTSRRLSPSHPWHRLFVRRALNRCSRQSLSGESCSQTYPHIYLFVSLLITIAGTCRVGYRELQRSQPAAAGRYGAHGALAALHVRVLNTFLCISPSSSDFGMPLVFGLHASSANVGRMDVPTLPLPILATLCPIHHKKATSSSSIPSGPSFVSSFLYLSRKENNRKQRKRLHTHTRTFAHDMTVQREPWHPRTHTRTFTHGSLSVLCATPGTGISTRRPRFTCTR